jgi:3-oxoacyl-[acyl-carrier-protein] synthase-3
MSLKARRELLAAIASRYGQATKAEKQKILDEFSPHRKVPYWTNLRTAGNTGAASIFIMLDEYLKTQPVSDGDRLILFVPESGQFNYVLISLTVICN